MAYKNIEYWKNRDLNPSSDYMPLLERVGRKRRIDAAKQIAAEQNIKISEEPSEALVQLFTVYYDSLVSHRPAPFN